MSDRYGCSLCDKTYSRKFDMKRHEQYAHPEMDKDADSSDEASEDGSDSSSKSDSDEHGGESDNESEEGSPETQEPEDNQAYQGWLDQAMTATKDLRDEKYQKYILEGMDEEDAKEKAHVKLLWAVRRTFFALYSKFLQESVSLENDDTHQKITSDLEKRVADGKPIRKAVQRVLAKHGPTFEGLFQYQEEEEEMEGTEESE